MPENGNEFERREEDEALSGQDELLYSIGEALRAKQTKEALAQLIQKYAEEIPKRGKAQRHALYLGHTITLIVIIAVGTMGYLKILSSETCGALFGAVVAGIYYAYRR